MTEFLIGLVMGICIGVISTAILCGIADRINQRRKKKNR